MNRKKEILKEYKERKIVGGVYKVINTTNGKYLLDHTPDLNSLQNHFKFAVSTGSAIQPKLKNDWKALGGEAFKLEIVEELEKKPDQSQAEFMEELKTLEQFVRANQENSDEY